MVLLDSDHLSLLQRGGAEGHRMKRRLGHLPATGSLGSEEFRQELLLPQKPPNIEQGNLCNQPLSV